MPSRSKAKTTKSLEGKALLAARRVLMSQIKKTTEAIKANVGRVQGIRQRSSNEINLIEGKTEDLVSRRKELEAAIQCIEEAEELIKD